MADPDGKAITAALAANVLGVRFQDLDAAAVEAAKLRCIDIIGCAIGGAAEPSNAGLVELLRTWGGRPQATVIGHGFQGPLHEVALVNCVLCRSFDWGALTLVVEGRRFPTHTSETTVPTALACGESQRASGRELITALIAGDDLAARLWMASERPQPGQGGARGEGFEPWGTITTFAAAAIAGRMLGLDEKQMRHALGIALNMMAGAGSGLWDGATMFKLSQGTSARSGVNAAQLAKAGWTGVEDPLFGAHGSYFGSIARGCDHPERITAGLGRVFHAETVFKPYPGGRPTHAPIDAALSLARRHDLRPQEVEAVVLRTSPPATAAHYAKPYKVGEYPTCDALFSYRYAVANALARRKAGNWEYSEGAIRDPLVQALVAKVRLEGLDRPRGVELEVTLKDGRVLSEYVAVALGEPENPLPREGLYAKFMTQVEYSGMVSPQAAEQLLRLLEHLEDVPDVTEVARLASRPG